MKTLMKSIDPSLGSIRRKASESCVVGKTFKFPVALPPGTMVIDSVTKSADADQPRYFSEYSLNIYESLSVYSHMKTCLSLPVDKPAGD